MQTWLDSLVDTAKRDGWATGRAPMMLIQTTAARLGWTEVPGRRGSPPVTTLRPTNQEDANPRSLSAHYGRGAQPLHTDGAHLAKPPDVVILTCTGTSDTPTRLWKTNIKDSFSFWPPDYVAHGVFLISNGRDSFFSTAFTSSGYRYDPGCMVPCDARARKAALFFEEEFENSSEHSWDEPGKILVIANRRALHARASATDDALREIHRISYYLPQESS